MKDQTYTSHSNLSSQPLIGKKRQFDNFTRRLSIGFSQTRLEKLDNGMNKFAKNRNSKGKLVPILYTLTYPSNDDWHPRDITNFCQRITTYAQRNWGFKLRYFWVAETTSKGVIHYHLTTWIPRNKRLPKANEPIKYKNRTYPCLWKYRAKVEGVKKGVYSYLLKYISKGCIISGLGIEKRLENKKGEMKTVKPRLFGYGGFTPNQREFMTYAMLPRYVRTHFDCVEYGDKVQRIKGGWQLKKRNILTKIGRSFSNFKSYYHYGNELLASNFSLWSAELNGHKVIGYDYGGFWSTIEENTNDVWYPF